METPCIIAIDDVNIQAHPEVADELLDFYQGLLGLACRSGGDESSKLAFSGVPVSGPWLVVNLSEQFSEDPFVGGRLTILVNSLCECAEQMEKRRLVYQWSRGLYFHDRRLIVLDPAGYRVELVTRHAI
jgi:hypothetical protein